MPSYTLSALSSLLYDTLDNNTGMYPQTQVTQVLNDTVRKLNLLAGIVQDTVPMLSVANQLEYSTPSGILIPIKVYAEGVELEKYSMRQLSTKYRNWATDSTAAYGPMARWCPIGIGQFVIHPQDAIGGRLIEVQGVAPITPMVTSGNTVDLDDELVPTLIGFDRARMLLKLGGKPFASASVAYQKFIQDVKDLVIWHGLIFPRYFIQSELEGSEGKGA